MLRNQLEIPYLGFFPPVETTSEQLGNLILQAIRIGYRMFYITESGTQTQTIWTAIKRSGIPRQQITIVAELTSTFFFGGLTKQRIVNWINDLDIGFIDVLFLNSNKFNDSNFYILKQLQQSGRIRSIGLSESSDKSISDIKVLQNFTPELYRYESKSFNEKYPIWDVLKKYNIGCLVNHDAQGLRSELIENSVLAQLSIFYNKTVSQIIQRWYLQSGILTVSNACDIETLELDMDIFDFELSETNIAVISNIEKSGNNY